MSRNSMKLVISDAEVSLVQMALAKEQHDRRGAFQNLQVQGHVKVVQTEKPAHITVQIEDEFIDDERARFPSPLLMAKLQLAVSAGRSCCNLPEDVPYGLAVSQAINTNAGAYQRQVLRYEQDSGRLDRPFGKSILLGMDYGREVRSWKLDESAPYPSPLKKRVTAAVKKFAKGLRP